MINVSRVRKGFTLLTILLLLDLLCISLIPTHTSSVIAYSELSKDAFYIGTTYKPGTIVNIRFFNSDNNTIVYLPNDAPWRIELNTSSGWVEVYTPPHNDTEIALHYKEFCFWQWYQVYDNGSQVPEGYYRIIFWTSNETYIEEFIISEIYGKIESGLAIKIDLLNKTGGVDPNKTFDVDIVFTVNVTQETVDEMVERIGNFTMRYYDTYYNLMSASLTKRQILKLAEWEIVDEIWRAAVLTIAGDSHENSHDGVSVIPPELIVPLVALTLLVVTGAILIYIYKRKK
ncbi:MAG: hypothetical protein J7L47_01555 [Candidatus Odinarchaeota archaeon]|nr:hypothetical protein [Candidatus Odinarchaeota archaeon]